jgi:hypothetical protein
MSRSAAEAVGAVNVVVVIEKAQVRTTASAAVNEREKTRTRL